MGHVLRGVAPEALFEGIEQGRLEAEAEHGVRLRPSGMGSTTSGPSASGMASAASKT
jgi:hypothetical protein